LTTSSVQRVRTQVARTALATVALCGVFAAGCIVDALFSPEFAADVDGGTHSYHSNAALPYAAITGLVALVAGCLGTGRAATCCRVIVGVGIFLLVMIASR